MNLKGTFNTVQAAIPHLAQQGRGKIVTVASELALVGRAGLSAYAASKAGVIGLTKCLARELAPNVPRTISTCSLTVLGLIESRLPISLSVRPSATR